MASSGISIQSTGLVTSVGLSAPAACAAIRAKLTNPRETLFIDAIGNPIQAHAVELEQPWRGVAKLARMAAMAIEECLQRFGHVLWPRLPLLLCVAEPERPGRAPALEDRLFAEIEDLLGMRFSADSAVISQGRVAVGVALLQARKLLYEGGVDHVLLAATDSLLNGPALAHYARTDRLLAADNSNGWMPGEGGGAVLLMRAMGGSRLTCLGLGFGLEPATIDSGEPLRAEGMTAAIQGALADAGCAMHDLDFRITGVSGEQYFFKEATLALSRTLRRRKEEFDIWHPAECTGEVGALSGVSALAVAEAAFRKGYAPGAGVLVHLSNDLGQRAAVVLYGEAPA